MITAKLYSDKVVPELMKELNIKNRLAVPRITKVVIAIGLGEAVKDKALLDRAGQELALITGQKPVVTKARKSVASFKLRKGMPIGLKVSLRKNRMYDFLDKLIMIVLPRLRDFRGLDEKHFDSQGNYTLGLREQIVFPEINYAKIDRIRGFEVTLVTSAHDSKTAKLLLSKLGVLFKVEK